MTERGQRDTQPQGARHHSAPPPSGLAPDPVPLLLTGRPQGQEPGRIPVYSASLAGPAIPPRAKGG